MTWDKPSFGTLLMILLAVGVAATGDLDVDATVSKTVARSPFPVLTYCRS